MNASGLIDSADALRRGMAAHQVGDIATAEGHYRRALSADPGHFDALHFLGIAYLQRSLVLDATRLIGRALRINTGFPPAYINLGNCLRSLGRPNDALASYDRALSIDPASVDALNNRGSLHLDLGHPDQARWSLEIAGSIRPDEAAVFFNRGRALQQLARPREALASFGRACAIRPDYVDAIVARGEGLQNLRRPAESLAAFRKATTLQGGHFEALWRYAQALSELNRLEEALASYDRALALMPGHPDIVNNRGVVLLFLKRPDQALRSFDLVLAHTPDHVDRLSNRSVALHELRRRPEALATCGRVLALAPSHPEALHNRGNALKELGQAEGALATYGRALAVRPGYVEALRNRGNLLRTLGHHREAIADFRILSKIAPDEPYVEGYLLHSQMNLCDWSDFEARVEHLSVAVRASQRACTPFAFFSVTGSEQEQSVCGEVFCQDNYPAPPAPLWAGERYGHERIRVAYLSSDFREHAISVLLAGLFERHDRRRFEITALSFGPAKPSAMRTRLEGAFERFIDVRNESDRSIAELVRGLEIDIAVDLMGHTHGNRLGVFAWRPAPVSVNFFCPTDAPFIDYLIADPVAIPEEHRRFHREKIAYLPDTFLATDSSRRIAARTPSRTELGLPEAAFVFCCFNNTYKLNPAMFAVWMRLLRRIDGSVLWLQQIQASATENLRREAAQAGIDPARLVFAPRLPSMEDHLARYRQADLFLDTLPFNAQTTATDALWAGLPVLTCLGTTFVGRVAASLLQAVGLPDLVAGSPAAYEARAMELAQDRTALAQIRAKLAANRETHPLFDTDRYRRHVESAYLAMWQRAQHDLPPETFMVSTQP